MAKRCLSKLAFYDWKYHTDTAIAMSPLFWLRFAFLRKPRMIEAPLGEEFETLRMRLPELVVNDSPSDWEECTDYMLKSPDYVFHGVKDGKVVAVIHNTDRYRETGPQRVKKLFYFLHARWATYSYTCDVFSAYRTGLIKRIAQPPPDSLGSDEVSDANHDPRNWPPRFR
jgi:hypothetical protein